MLKVEHISSGYGKKQVLFDVSFEVKQGEVVLLTGGNGSGKTTLLKCIYNMLPCWSGEITFKGERINRLEPFDLIRRDIVYIPQKEFYFENLSVDENLRTSGNKFSMIDLQERITEVYKLTGLTRFKKRKPFNLSGGERKILAFGMGLIHNPEFLLFDEPFAGMDAKNTAILLNLFKKTIISHNKGIIIVEHKDDARQLYTRRCKMEIGTII